MEWNAWRFGCEHEEFNIDIVSEFRISPDMKCSHVEQPFARTHFALFLHRMEHVFLLLECECSLNTKQMELFTEVWIATHKNMPSYHLQTFGARNEPFYMIRLLVCVNSRRYTKRSINDFINVWTPFKLLSNDQINHVHWMT